MMRFFFGFFLVAVLAGGGGSPVSAQSDEPNVAMFLCFGVNTRGNRETRNSLVLALEQTNADEQDGAILLEDHIYDRVLFGGMRPIAFRVRIFRGAGARENLIEGTPEEEVTHLLSDEIPSDAYVEFDDALGQISWNSFLIGWDRNDAGERAQDVRYHPSNKDLESWSRYDGIATLSSASVWCEPPFMRGGEAAPSQSPASSELAQTDHDSEEVGGGQATDLRIFYTNKYVPSGPPFRYMNIGIGNNVDAPTPDELADSSTYEGANSIICADAPLMLSTFLGETNFFVTSTECYESIRAALPIGETNELIVGYPLP